MSLAASIGAGACLTRLASPVAASVRSCVLRSRSAVDVRDLVPPDELPRALHLWPDMVEWDFVDHAGISRHVEPTLRRLAEAGPHDLDVSPMRVADYVNWCEVVSDQFDDAALLARYADVVGMRGDAVKWPPKSTRRAGAGAAPPTSGAVELHLMTRRNEAAVDDRTDRKRGMSGAFRTRTSNSKCSSRRHPVECHPTTLLTTGTRVCDLPGLVTPVRCHACQPLGKGRSRVLPNELYPELMTATKRCSLRCRKALAFSSRRPRICVATCGAGARHWPRRALHPLMLLRPCGSRCSHWWSPDDLCVTAGGVELLQQSQLE